MSSQRSHISGSACASSHQCAIAACVSSASQAIVRRYRPPYSSNSSFKMAEPVTLAESSDPAVNLLPGPGHYYNVPLHCESLGPCHLAPNPHL
ncbi:hypothetical protein PLICRDRAFT_46222 [Plicaturopsis crispa FD-325 SS-3]|uniref:Uncharacterized protein n=1 Tax=Plicaturopsis crispa FD-325 SS-3 TaxID=944288 RepID=A0A0C9SKU5_PLICR|nr:hypothetical protein PLICRDRAFT_46222 [Plicaturopsis crispa FD-325 SS-3]